MNSPWRSIARWAPTQRPSYRLLSTAASPVLKVQTHPAPHSGHIKVLFFDIPETRNALSKTLVASLKSQLKEIQAQSGNGPTRALVLASAVDKVFCAGADLKERKSFTQEETRSFLTDLRQTFKDISDLEIPTISAVSGIALGGGLELALCTHFRVFGSSAVVGQPETRLAIIPGAGGTYRLPALIGLNRARDMILTGRQIGGAEAYFVGLCDRLIEITTEEIQAPGAARVKVLNHSLDLARDLCQGGPVALKQAMKAVHGWQRGEEAENEAYEVVLRTKDRLEALKAFAEKRAPIFRGE